MRRDAPALTTRTLGPSSAVLFGLSWGLMAAAVVFVDQVEAVIGEPGYPIAAFILAASSIGAALKGTLSEPFSSLPRGPRWSSGSGPARRAECRVVPLTVMATLLLGWGSPAVAADRGDTQRAGQVLAARMDDVGVPGSALAVVDRDGDAVVQGLGETGDGRNVTADTPFVIGSTSKSFTALAVMQLVDDGLVDLDASVRRYVPELRLADPGAADTITVRHLLQQTSGLPGTAGGPILKSAADGTALDAVGELSGARLSDPPGAVWHYSNANYVLAGLVVERATGISYAEHVQRRIFTPLAMTGSATSLPVAVDDGVVSPGHRLWFGVPVSTGPAHRPGLLAAGYLVSTAADMGRYLQMYLRGGLGPDGTQIVSADGLRVLTAPGPAAHLGGWADGAPARYAMGWFVGGPWAEPVLFHPGNTPDSSAMITLIPGRGTAVATLMNLSHELPVPGNPSAPDRLSRNVVDALLGEPVDTGPSTRRFYLLFDAIVLLLVGVAGWSLWRAVASFRRGTDPRHRLPALLGVGLRGAAIALLATLPAGAGYGWASAWVWAPDLTLTLAVLIVLLVLIMSVRLVALVRSLRPAGHRPGERPAPRLAR